MNLNTDIRYPLNAHDFRLVDRKVINGFKDNSNLYPYVRGLTFALAKKPIGIAASSRAASGRVRECPSNWPAGI